MFGKKKDQEMSTNADTSTASPAGDQSKSYLRQDAPSSPGVSRPAAPEIARRPPDLSAFTQRRDQPTSPRAGETTDHKKLIVGREIILNGEIRTCDFLVVEGRVEAVLQDCKNIEIMAPGEFKGAAEVDVADISGRFDGDLTARQRLIVRQVEERRVIPRI